MHAENRLGRNARVALIALAVFTAPTFATVRHVDDGGPVNGNGLSWGQAHRHLTDAIAAAGSGDEIRIAGGLYRPDESNAARNGSGDRNASFLMHDNVKLLGGYAGIGAANPNLRDPETFVSVLSGDLLGDDASGADSENSLRVVRCVSEGTGQRLDGFTVTGGNANLPETAETGAGLWVTAGMPQIASCRFVGNRCSVYGAGIRLEASAAEISDCTFVGNVASGAAAIYSQKAGYLPPVVGCHFEGNVASSYHGSAVFVGGPGAGSTEMTVTDCVFISNQTAVGGAVGALNGVHLNCSGSLFSQNVGVAPAAIMIFDTPSYIVGCAFDGNTGGGNGAVGLWENDGGAVLNAVVSSRFTGNSRTWRGGGAALTPPCALVNCVFSQNVALIEGGALYFDNGYHVANSSFSQNKPDAGAGGTASSTFRNSIIWNNEPGQWGWGASSVDADHLLVQGGWPGGADILSVNPLFVAPDSHDLRLSIGSPAINAGLGALLPQDVADLDNDGNTTEPLPLDIDGLARVQGAAPDLGAHEGGINYTPPQDEESQIDPGETVQLDTGEDSSTPAVMAQLTNSGGGVAAASLSQIGWDLHPGSDGFSEDGLVAALSASIPLGAHLTQVRIPINLFTIYPHGDLAGMRVTRFDESVQARRLAVAMNVNPAVNGTGGTVGQTHLIFEVPGVPPAVPTALGDHGVYWIPTALQGFVFANVDTDGEFGVGRSVCPADIAPAQSASLGDGVVDGLDYGAMLAAWGGTGPADLTFDGIVNDADVAVLLAAWTGLGGGCDNADDEGGGGGGAGAPPTEPPPGFNPARADLSRDGKVNGADLGRLYAAWQPHATVIKGKGKGKNRQRIKLVPADLNRDRKVDGADLGLLLSCWGWERR